MTLWDTPFMAFFEIYTLPSPTFKNRFYGAILEIPLSGMFSWINPLKKRVYGC